MLKLVLLIVSSMLLNSCASLLGVSISAEDAARVKSDSIPILITRLQRTSPNSAGGVDVRVNYANTSGKRFKYVVFTVKPFNAVGDLVSSDIGSKVFARLNDTGPIKTRENWDYHGGQDGGLWANVWYNNSISCIELVGVEITYMDGDKISFDKDGISSILVSSISNSCEVD
jgi:hypothetical protein